MRYLGKIRDWAVKGMTTRWPSEGLVEGAVSLSVSPACPPAQTLPITLPPSFVRQPWSDTHTTCFLSIIASLTLFREMRITSSHERQRSSDLITRFYPKDNCSSDWRRLSDSSLLLLKSVVLAALLLTRYYYSLTK